MPGAAEVTEPGASPGKQVSETGLPGKGGPSRKAIFGWGVGMPIFLALAMGITWVVVAVRQAGAAVSECSRTLHDPYAGREEWAGKAEREIERLGGPRQAARRLSLYLSVPRRWAPCRDVAALMLWPCGQAGVPKLIDLLGDADAEVRWRTAYALGELADHSSVGPLAAAAGKEADPRARRQMVRALGQIGDREALGALVAALKDLDGDVREAAADALENIRAAPTRREQKP